MGGCSIWKFFRRRWLFSPSPEIVCSSRKRSFFQAIAALAIVCHMPGNRDQQAGVLPLLRRPERGWRSHLLLERIYNECLQEDEENGCNYGIRRIIPWLKLHRCYADGDRRVYRICWKHRLIIQSKQHHPNWPAGWKGWKPDSSWLYRFKNQRKVPHRHHRDLHVRMGSSTWLRCWTASIAAIWSRTVWIGPREPPTATLMARVRSFLITLNR